MLPPGLPAIPSLPDAAPLVLARLNNIANRFDLPRKAIAGALGISYRRLAQWADGSAKPRNEVLVLVTLVDRITSLHPNLDVLSHISGIYTQFLVTTERKRQYPGKVQTKRRLAARAKRAAEAAKAASSKPQ